MLARCEDEIWALSPTRVQRRLWRSGNLHSPCDRRDDGRWIGTRGGAVWVRCFPDFDRSVLWPTAARAANESGIGDHLDRWLETRRGSRRRDDARHRPARVGDNGPDWASGTSDPPIGQRGAATWP